MDSRKSEHIGVLAVENLVSRMGNAIANLSRDDKRISWDGDIELFNGSTNNKKNYIDSIPVQIKRKIDYCKKERVSLLFELEVDDLKNYLTKDGSILFVISYKQKDEFNQVVFYASLLPYDINKLLLDNANNQTGKIKIKTKPIHTSEQLDKICNSFLLNRGVQKKMSTSSILNNHIMVGTKLYIPLGLSNNETIDRDLDSVIGNEQYLYMIDDNRNIIGVIKEQLKSYIIHDSRCVLSATKDVIYDDLLFSKNSNNVELYEFGKAFYIDSSNSIFSYNICGTLNERIKQLLFIKNIICEEYFTIGNEKYSVQIDKTEEQNINHIYNMYVNFKNVLSKHHINKDVNLDIWEENDYIEFNYWMNAIEKGISIKLITKENIMGIKRIGDLKLSIITTVDEKGLSSIDLVFDNNMYNKFNFRIVSDAEELYTNNLFLVLNKECYFGDNIDIDKMIQVMNCCSFTKDEYILLNAQIIEIIKAYDSIHNESLLEYALFLSKILIDNDSQYYNCYYINYCQILKRLGKLSIAEHEKLIEIRDKEEQLDVKLYCNALLDNRNETIIIKNKLDANTLEFINQYPISIYL